MGFSGFEGHYRNSGSAHWFETTGLKVQGLSPKSLCMTFMNIMFTLYTSCRLGSSVIKLSVFSKHLNGPGFQGAFELSGWLVS